MATTEPKVGRVEIDGRALFVCDNFIDAASVTEIGTSVRGLHYIRKEKSRPDVPGLVAVADIETAILASHPFFARLRRIAEKMFPGEALQDMRAYVNSAIYGDSYYVHRDCPPDSSNVTVLYYANLDWQADWGGETIFYNENKDAVFVVSPRPGRMVVSRGAILHRAAVPTRDCYEQRLTIAYKLISSGPANPVAAS